MSQESNKKLVVNVYGASGVGKSILATQLANNMKLKGIKAEYCREWIKEVVLSGQSPASIPQCEITYQQSKLLKMYLDSGCDVVVTDSPLLLGYVYGKVYNDPISLDLVKELEPKTDIVNIFLVHDQDNITFQKHGRVESYQESLKNESLIRNAMAESRLMVRTFTLKQALDYMMKHEGLL